jgi:S-DNA-T family DNA segregation ATPase FtsK/SpoIIIE
MNDDDMNKKFAQLEERMKKLEEKVFKEDKDVIFEDVVKLIKDYDMVSASLLQRRFSVGYARAARLLDELEDKGYIAKGEGAKPRKVLLK